MPGCSCWSTGPAIGDYFISFYCFGGEGAAFFVFFAFEGQRGKFAHLDQSVRVGYFDLSEVLNAKDYSFPGVFDLLY